MENIKNKMFCFKTFSLKLLIGFFTLMFILTLISTAADSITTAKVMLESPQSQPLTFDINGTGKIKSDFGGFIYGPLGMRIEDIYVKEGDQVKNGDLLAQIDMEDLVSKIDSENLKLKKLEIQLEQEKLLSSSLFIPEEISAANSLEFLKRDLENAEEDLNTANAEYAEAIKKSAADMIQQKQKEYDVERENYENLKESYDDALYEAKNNLNNANSKFGASESQWLAFKSLLSGLRIDEWGNIVENSSYEAILKEGLGADYLIAKDSIDSAQAELEQAERNLNNISPDSPLYQKAMEDYEAAKNKYTTAVSGVKRIRDFMQYYLSGTLSDSDMYENIYGQSLDENLFDNAVTAQERINRVKEKWRRTLEKAQKSLEEKREELENAKEGKTEVEAAAEKAAVKSIEKSILQLQRSVEEAEIRLEQAKKQDENTLRNMSVQEKRSALSQQSLQLDINEQRKVIERLKKIYSDEGRITADKSGVADSILIEAGQRISDMALISLCNDTYSFEAELGDQEAKRIKTGDQILIKLASRKNNIESEIGSLNFNSEENAEITAPLGGSDYVNGISASFSIRKKTEIYNMTIPASALHFSQQGYYVLIAKEQDTILGKRLAASKVIVEVIDNDGMTAAVAGDLTSKSMVIVNSSKNIEDGDRVRIKE